MEEKYCERCYYKAQYNWSGKDVCGLGCFEVLMSQEDVNIPTNITKVNKPWGHELIWAKTDKYVGKILHINKGHKLSRQYHNLKEETFLVKSGKLKLEIGDGSDMITLYLQAGESYHCTPKTIHRMIAEEYSVDVIEVSTPELDDVVRLADEYGRNK